MMHEERISLLLQLIRNEKNEVPDKSGNTPLFKKAIFFEKLPQTDSDKIEEIKAIAGLQTYFNDFDQTDYRNLFSYISTGILYNTYLKENFEGYLLSLSGNIKLNNKDLRMEALKRIFLIQFLQTVDESSLNESIINQQEVIKNHFPLNYAVLLSSISLEKGAPLLKELFEKQPRYAIIYENREQWLKKFGRRAFAKYVLPLYKFLDKEEKKDLRDFCISKSIHFTEKDKTSMLARLRFKRDILGEVEVGRIKHTAIPKIIPAAATIPEFVLIKPIGKELHHRNSDRKSERIKMTN